MDTLRFREYAAMHYASVSQHHPTPPAPPSSTPAPHAAKAPTMLRPIQAGLGVYLAFCISMGSGFLLADDIWLHWLWAICFFIAAVTCTILVWGGSNRWLEPAGSLITTALCARPAGIAVEVVSGNADRTPPRILLTVALYLGFAAVTAIFFILAARLRED